MKTYLAIDQGTHASRAILYDLQGRQVAYAKRNVEIFRYDDGRIEQDPGNLANSVKLAVNQIVASSQYPIAACGIATQRSTVLAWHADGTPISSALSWQDVRGASFLENIRHHETEIRQISGLPLSPHFGASKLHWLYEQIKKDSPNVAQLRLSPLISFLLFHLLESQPYQVDHGNAQRTQLMDLASLDWSSRLLQWFQIPIDLLPQCTPICQNYGFLKDTTIPVVAVNGDQNAAFFGAGQLESDSALINLGSGAFILRDIGSKPTPSQYQLTGIALSNQGQIKYLREATINGAGNALEWARTKWRIEDLPKQLPTWLAHFNDPPVFINTLGGLGSPWWRQDLKPTFIGEQQPNPGLERRVVAIVESISFMIQANIELMTQESPLSKLYVSGGLSDLDGLCQQLANLSGLVVKRLGEPETTARGIAWLAAGCPQDWQTAIAIDQFMPRTDPGLISRYRLFSQFLERYRPS